MDSGLDQRPRRNLRTMLIDPFKQIKFGLYVISISVAFTMISAGMFFLAFTEQYKHVMGIFQVIDPNLKWELVVNDIFFTNAVRIGAVFALYITVMFAVVFRLTHRYYGPLVSIARFVEQFGGGDYSKRLVIRDRDELHELVHKLNDMAELIEKRHGAREGSVRGEDQEAS